MCVVCLGDQVQSTQSLVREGLEEKSDLTVMLLPMQKLDFQDLGHHVKEFGGRSNGIEDEDAGNF